MIKIIGMLFILLIASRVEAASKFEILPCQGEGCGCTRENKANESFTLYAEMDSKSKVLGKFKAGTKANVNKAFTKVIKPGSAQVIRVDDPTIGLKIGDKVTHVFNAGEGLTEVMKNKEWIQFEAEKVKLKEIEESVYEFWTEIHVGKLTGYAPTFPFVGCLE
jgi:hypothetical protein